MKKMNKVFYIILISLFSLTVISCSRSYDGASTTTDTTAPTVSSFYPTDNQTILISDNISVTFSESMDNASVTTNTSNTSCSGSFQLSSDNFSSCILISSVPSISNSNKTFSIDPSDNLSRLTTYRIRVTTGVMDSFGNTMSSDNTTETGFTADAVQNVTLQGRSDGKGVDFVITGDGFKLDQLDDFRIAVQNYVDYFFFNLQ